MFIPARLSDVYPLETSQHTSPNTSNIQQDTPFSSTPPKQAQKGTIWSKNRTKWEVPGDHPRGGAQGRGESALPMFFVETVNIRIVYGT